MDTKLKATRAVLTELTRRAVRFWTFITFGIFLIIFALCVVLVTYVSPWWWLLLIAYIPLLAFALVVRAVIGVFLTKFYPIKTLSTTQKKAVKNFADKLQRLAETRGMGWFVFTLLCFKDLLFHQDLTTARNTLEDATSLRKDFEELENTLRA